MGGRLTSPAHYFLKINIMTEKHKTMVLALIKPGNVIADETTGNEANLLHMALGIYSEAGELLDAIKKNVIYKRALDLDNVVEELGDLEFYMEGLRQALYLNRGDILQSNIDKLSKRYQGGIYSNTSAQERADKI